VVIPSSRAFAVGIIVNELVTNAYKYAFVSIPRGRIDIVAQMIGTDRLEISVSDNGTGMKVTSLDPAMGFGLQMVNALARQHGGTMAIHAPRTGSKITVEIAVS
jgi:two-component sensor histidine kinase